MRIRTNRLGAAALAAVCSAAGLADGGCTATTEPGIESAAEPAPSVTPAPITPAPIPAGPTDRFKVQYQEGLTFRIDTLNASVQLYAQNRKGRPQVRRDISINGSVQDPQGRRLFRIAGVELESMTDGLGRSLLDGAEVSEHPPAYNDPWENIRMNRHPGNASSQSYNIQVGGLDALPAKLGAVRGHVDVELVTDMMSVDLVAEQSDTFVEPVEGVAYRVPLFQTEGSTLRFLIEYKLARGAGADGRAPVFLGLEARDQRGQPVHLNVRPLETVLGNAVHGSLQGEVGMSRGGMGPVKMLFATDMKPLRFDFEFGDIALTESDGAR